jgi:hypothetical protein
MTQKCAPFDFERPQVVNCPPLLRDFAIRVQTKTLFYKALDFKTDSLNTDKNAQTLLPSPGIVFSFELNREILALERIGARAGIRRSSNRLKKATKFMQDFIGPLLRKKMPAVQSLTCKGTGNLTSPCAEHVP